MKYKIPFEKPLNNVLEVLVGTADKTPQERLEVLGPLGNVRMKFLKAVSVSVDRVCEKYGQDYMQRKNLSRNLTLEEFDKLLQSRPKEVAIHELTNQFNALFSPFSAFENYEVLEKYGEIGDATPEKIIEKYKSKGEELSEKEIESIETRKFRHPIADRTEMCSPYKNWTRRTFTPEDQMLFAEMYKKDFEKFKYNILGPKYVSKDFVESVEKNILPEFKGKDRSMLNSMGPEAYQNAMRILEEEYAKLDK